MPEHDTKNRKKHCIHSKDNFFIPCFAYFFICKLNAYSEKNYVFFLETPI